MSDTPKNLDDQLRQHLRQSAQDALGDWTFSPDMRAAVHRQVREQQRANTWAKAGRAARDAGWLVAAAAIVFMLTGHNTGPTPGAPAAATRASYAPMAATTPTPAPGSNAAANQTTAQPAAPAPKSADHADASVESTAATSTATPGLSPQANAADAKAAVADSTSTTTHPGAATTALPDTAKVPNTPPVGGLKPHVTVGGGSVSNTMGLAPAATALVQTLPAPQATASKPLIASDLQVASQSGVALQALPGQLLVYAKTGDTLLVRAFTADLQSQWAAPADVHSVPVLQARGTLVMDRGILFWQDGQVIVRDMNGTQRQLLMVGDGQQVHGLHMTGNRWLTIVGLAGGEPVAWLVDLDLNRVVGLKLSADAVDAIALDGTRLGVLDAKSQLLLLTVPALP